MQFAEQMVMFEPPLCLCLQIGSGVFVATAGSNRIMLHQVSISITPLSALVAVS